MSQPQRNFFSAAFALAFVAGGAQAQAEASTLSAVSALPIASISQPAADLLAAGGAVFAVKAVQAGAYTTAYALERLSDGAQVRLEITGRGVNHTAMTTGALVTAMVKRTGVVLSVGDNAVAFVPNTLGRALMRRESAIA
jgi:hypothetical protein